MPTYSFAVPILPGKIESWRKYVQELNGPRWDEYRRSRQRIGLNVEQVWLQNTPDGDQCIVRMETDNPTKVFEYFRTSQEPFDTWFRDKILVECHGMDLSEPITATNEQVLNYTGQPVAEKTYADTKKR
jgi:hypothetical protein